MWRYLLSAGAALLLGLATVFFFRAPASSEPSLLAGPRALAATTGDTEAEDPLPDEAPRATARTREQKRFDRYDKDRDETITRDEYLLSRRKAFAKLDVNGDGRLSFEEWVVKTGTKFAAADGDRSGALTRIEFAATAPKRKAKRPSCACKPAVSEQEAD